MIKIFQNQRYLTRGISEEIPLEIQFYMWQLIDDLLFESKATDYLQVFELTATTKDNRLVQQITHRQEHPKYERKYTIVIDKPIKKKIFVIDDVTHCTMLLAEEY